MADLTKEYFDKKLDNLATKQDIKHLDSKIDGLKAYTDKHIDNLAVTIARHFERLEGKIDETRDLRKRVERLEHALNLH